MTPEEMGKALGPGWARTRHHVWTRDGRLRIVWYPASLAVIQDGTLYKCMTPEVAVAVAHLLVAAERIAAGAEVARSDFDQAAVLNMQDKPAALKYRAALDLLRAADEAEAQP